MLIGLSGKAGAGKDTIADYLATVHGFERVAFADPLRELANNYSASYRSDVAKLGYERAKAERTHVRAILQELGQACRDTFGEDFWVEQARRRVDNLAARVVVTDVRHRNEADMIRALGGFVFRVERDVPAVREHVSETALDDYRFDGTIGNDGTLGELHDAIEGALVWCWARRAW